MKFEIIGIKKKYGKKIPLSDVSFEAESGKCIGILGRNGSGKSTLLSILAGVRDADGGSFAADGRELLSGKSNISNLVGYVPQGTPLIEELSARDNLLLWYDKKALERELDGGVLDMLGINDFINLPVRKMSGGMKKRLSIGCSVAKHPSLLLLDEPCAALDIICKQSIREYLEAFKAAGGAIILATHDEGELALCDEIYVLKDGTLSPYRYSGDIADLIEKL